MLKRALSLWAASSALASVALAAPACLQVDGERILAKDLAAALPALAALPPDTALAYSPAPGAQRIFRSAELARIGLKYNLALDTTDAICTERATATLTPERILAAMRAAPGLSEARIEILDFSHAPMPLGALEFALSGLTAAPGAGVNTPLIWKGYVRSSPRRRFPVWARVKITVSTARVVAAEDLRSGQPITDAQVRLERHEGFLSMQHAVSLDQVIGRLPRRPMTAGSPILLPLLESAKDVERGQTVDIEVTTGGARLAFAGKAETSGRRGELISIRNTVSGKTFRARVTGPGKVSVAAGAKS
jgi:flagella basal body P-ring formation protein FlgA